MDLELKLLTGRDSFRKLQNDPWYNNFSLSSSDHLRWACKYSDMDDTIPTALKTILRIMYNALPCLIGEILGTALQVEADPDFDFVKGLCKIQARCLRKV